MPATLPNPASRVERLTLARARRSARRACPSSGRPASGSRPASRRTPRPRTRRGSARARAAAAPGAGARDPRCRPAPATTRPTRWTRSMVSTTCSPDRAIGVVDHPRVGGGGHDAHDVEEPVGLLVGEQVGRDRLEGHDVAAGPQHAGELREGVVGMLDVDHHVAAPHQVERGVGHRQVAWPCRARRRAGRRCRGRGRDGPRGRGRGGAAPGRCPARGSRSGSRAGRRGRPRRTRRRRRGCRGAGRARAPPAAAPTGPAVRGSRRGAPRRPPPAAGRCRRRTCDPRPRTESAATQ